jgi:4-hydroxybenzoate polyprenyltransferase
MLSRLGRYASFVRFSHSVFVLPFALVGALMAARAVPLTTARVAWIVAAMVTARSAAMGFNRLVDARFDALNPRTSMRELPRGAMSRGEAIWFVAIMAGAFVGCAYALGPLCFLLSPLALAIVFWYSLAKRYTWATQFFLGLAMAVAPVGGWLAAGGGPGPEPAWLALAVGSWVAGFDVLYACQDLAVDRRLGLGSVPARFGVAAALRISRALHVVTVACLLALGVAAGLGAVYYTGIVAVAALLAYEQSLVRADDLSQIKRAFDLNGYVGILFVLTTGVALYVG